MEDLQNIKNISNGALKRKLEELNDPQVLRRQSEGTISLKVIKLNPRNSLVGNASLINKNNGIQDLNSTPILGIRSFQLPNNSDNISTFPPKVVRISTGPIVGDGDVVGSTPSTPNNITQPCSLPITQPGPDTTPIQGNTTLSLSKLNFSSLSTVNISEPNGKGFKKIILLSKSNSSSQPNSLTSTPISGQPINAFQQSGITAADTGIDFGLNIKSEKDNFLNVSQMNRTNYEDYSNFNTTSTGLQPASDLVKDNFDPFENSGHIYNIDCLFDAEQKIESNEMITEDHKPVIKIERTSSFDEYDQTHMRKSLDDDINLIKQSADFDNDHLTRQPNVKVKLGNEPRVKEESQLETPIKKSYDSEMERFQVLFQSPTMVKPEIPETEGPKAWAEKTCDHDIGCDYMVYNFSIDYPVIFIKDLLIEANYFEGYENMTFEYYGIRMKGTSTLRKIHSLAMECMVEDKELSPLIDMTVYICKIDDVHVCFNKENFEDSKGLHVPEKIIPTTEVPGSPKSTSNLSSEVETIKAEKTKKGKTKEEKAEGNASKRMQLWQYVLISLLEGNSKDKIDWVNSSGGLFRFIRQEEYAQQWASIKGKSSSTGYANMSRSLRNYYKQDIMRKDSKYKFSYTFTKTVEDNIGFTIDEMRRLYGKENIDPQDPDWEKLDNLKRTLANQVKVPFTDDQGEDGESKDSKLKKFKSKSLKSKSNFESKNSDSDESFDDDDLK